MMPVSVGYQDLGALIARQPGVTERGRQHVRNSTFGTIHAATFSFPRPVGTVIPEAPGYQLASLDPRALDITGAINHRALDPFVPPAPPLDFPVVDRRLKGDLLVPRSRPVPPEPSRAKPRKQDTAEVEKPAPTTAPPVPQAQAAAPVVVEPEKPKAEPKSRPKPAPVIAEPVKPEPAPAPVIAEPVDAEPAPGVASPAQPEPAPVIAAPVPEPAPVIAAPAQTEAEPPFTEVAPKATDQIATVPADNEPETKPAQEVADAELPIDSWPADDRMMETRPGAAAQAAPELLTDERPDETDTAAFEPVENENPALRAARIFFGTDTIGPGQGVLQPWAPGEAPTFVTPRIPADPDIKLSALTPPNILKDDPPEAAPRDFENKHSEGKHGEGKDGESKDESRLNETVAAKGEVTGEGKRPKTPAERLGLAGASRVKHERCLSNAIYFEARGEAERGQMAVAQVVLNRAFSGYYPDNVCDVVYQNAHRHLACQFTFACDGIRDVVTEPDAWETAKRIARDSLDGKIWLSEIGKATHYHATYVSPWWVRTMKKHQTLGIHIFYRPRRWGDGAEAPVWGQTPVEATGSIKGAKDAKAPTANAPAAKL